MNGPETSARGINPTVRECVTSGNFTSRTERQTFDLGARIGAGLRGGEVILLDGPLGAGKTVLVKGLACALGLNEADITSPSFTLVNAHPGRLLLYHIDLYRLEAGASAAYAIDLDEILTDEAAVVIIEWAERLGHYPLPAGVWRISIAGDGDEPRQISIASATS
jgi:tRNA threonylcarbamoyladenosine biosynthesis protein TsaE